MLLTGHLVQELFYDIPADKAVFKDASNNINGTFVGNITGNVDTATALETARTIGTSFDGTGTNNCHIYRNTS